MEKAPWEIEAGLSKRELLRLGLYGCLSLLAVGLGIPSDYIPEERLFNGTYGKILKRIRPNAPNQLYIIGQYHSLNILDDDLQELWGKVSGEKTDKKVDKTQFEIYRIIGGLIKNRGINLVLAEGAFSDEDNKWIRDLIDLVKKDFRSSLIEEFKREGNDSKLEYMLRDVEVVKEAVWLSGFVYGINIQGAESRILHETQRAAANSYIRLSLLGKEDSLEDLNDYVKELRSAEILKNSPEVIEREIKAGRVKKREAIITIGAGHLGEMIKFIEEDHITIKPPRADLDERDEDLHLKGKGYGVTIIVPREILKRKILEK